MNQKKLIHLAGYRIKITWLKFKDKISMYQSKAKLNVKSLCDKITLLLDLKKRKMLVRDLHWNKDSTSDSGT